MKHVFVSSTFIDLEQYRAKVIEALRIQDLVDIAMETFGARDDRADNECVKLISEKTDIFVGIYAYRYGYIPDGSDVSITELEYIHAVDRNIPTLVYLVDKDAPWIPQYIDEGEPKERLDRFKKRLKKARICGFFKSPEDLAMQISSDVARTLAEKSSSHVFFRGLYHQPPDHWNTPVQHNKNHYKLVIFDMDGTLVKGSPYEFSWVAVWNYLNYSRSTQKKLKTEYRKKSQASKDKLARIDAYKEWCDQAVERFKQRKVDGRKIKRSDFKTIVTDCFLPRNFEETIGTLKAEGFALAIVSGGINTFLEDVIPSYDVLFDFVFVNELLFDDHENLSGVNATAYDFEGKVDALEIICERCGCSKDEVVFVGDHYNDEFIMNAAGKAIAFPAHDLLIEDTDAISLSGDDLKEILPHILDT